MPITSGEQLQTPRQYHPYFQAGSMDVVMIDVQYQGFGASKKTADLAETYEINIAPHNFNSHLATYQSLNLTAASSNVRIMESDVDSMPWRDEIVTKIPEVVNGEIAVPMSPGWGADLDEEAARRNAWTP